MPSPDDPARHTADAARTDGRPAPAEPPAAPPEAPPARGAGRPGPASGGILSEQSGEDTDAAWGDYPERAGDRLLRDRPPHWEDD
jgi:hypothetical protein